MVSKISGLEVMAIAVAHRDTALMYSEDVTKSM